MKLVDVPKHEFMESPSSWLTRIALRQVVSPRELARYIGLKTKTDCEMTLARTSFAELATKLTESSHSSALVDSVMNRLREIDPSGDRYLLRHRSFAYHRFCAPCLATDRTKYFRIEWRFKCWRWCPLHCCLLHERCPHCNRLVTLPRDMYTARSDGLGIATLDRCLRCGNLLTSGWKKFVNSLADEIMTPWERVQIKNGRAALASLANGRLRFQGEEKIHSFMQLKRIERLGYLPHINFRLTPEELLHRKKNHIESSSEQRSAQNQRMNKE